MEGPTFREDRQGGGASNTDVAECLWVWFLPHRENCGSLWLSFWVNLCFCVVCYINTYIPYAAEIAEISPNLHYQCDFPPYLSFLIMNLPLSSSNVTSTSCWCYIWELMLTKYSRFLNECRLAAWLPRALRGVTTMHWRHQWTKGSCLAGGSNRHRLVTIVVKLAFVLITAFK